MEIIEGIKELQTGREEYLVEIMDKSVGSDEASIAVVGIDHVIPRREVHLNMVLGVLLEN